MADYSFSVRPYSNIDLALRSIANSCHYSCFKLKKDNNYSKMYGRILNGFFVGKAMLTIEQNFTDFCKKYHIEYITKVMWDVTTWEVNYNASQYTLRVYSGTCMGPWAHQYDTVRDSIVFISREMISQAKDLLMIAEREWPRERFSEIYYRIKDHITITTN